MLIEAPELATLSGLRHAFFTRRGGVSGGLYASLNGGLGSSDDTGAVAENRRLMAEHFALPGEALVSLRQVHSAKAVVVEQPWPGDGRPQADGMATRVPGLVLAIATADCGPVLFADAQAGVVGACHAGWKGALGGVIEATLDAMESLGAARGRITAVLGPTIGPDAYEVGADFVAGFAAADPETLRHFRPSSRSGHSLFDLPAYIGTRLRAAGVARAGDLGLCTYADEDRFYSYRRTTHRAEPDYGRLISGIALTR